MEGKLGVYAETRKPDRKSLMPNDIGPSQSQIGEWLAKKRESARMTQRQAGNYIDTDAGTISRWERGTMPMSAVSFLALVWLYNATSELTELFSKLRRKENPERKLTVGRENDIPIPDPTSSAAVSPKRRRRPA